VIEIGAKAGGRLVGAKRETTVPNGTGLYKPSNVQLGGQRTSASQLRVWTTCHQEWFLSYLCPHPDVLGSAGLRPPTSADALLVGSHFHAAMAAYLTSGWRDGEDSGERDPEKAIAAVEEQAAARAGEAESPEQAEENATLAKQLILKYDEKREQYYEHRVVADSDGEPVVEREFQIPVGVDDEFVYVDKVDAILETREGYHMVGEWKTSSYRFVNQALAGLHMQGQTYGHMGVLTKSFPTAPINGVHYKLFVKDRGKKSQLPDVYERDIVIPALNVETYFKSVEDWLYELVDLTNLWQDRVEGGDDPYQAGLDLFSQHGLSNGMCQRYGRLCDFAGYCENHGLGSRALRGFRPRTVEGEVYKEEGDNGDDS